MTYTKFHPGGWKNLPEKTTPAPAEFFDQVEEALDTQDDRIVAVEAGQVVVTAATKTASYTLALSDAGKSIEMDLAAAGNVTVPPNSSVAFPVGTVLEVVRTGTGQVTFVAGTGVTLRTPSSLTTRAQWSSVSLRKRATDEWVLAGDLT